MDTRRLGPDGPTLSVVGIGTNSFGRMIEADAATAVVHAALDAGITHFDTAEMYGEGRSEEMLGAALRGRRDRAVIATKVLPRPSAEPYRPGILAARIREAAEQSLRRLGTDHIDVLYQHYPDPEAPVDEALEAFDALIRAGTVGHIASSNVTGDQIAEAARVAVAGGWTPFTGTQFEWSLLARAVEADEVPAATAAGLGIVPYFPLAAGMLTGKYRRGQPFPEGSRMARSDRWARMVTDDAFDRVEALETWAADHGHSTTELAVAWLLARPAVTSVITGATRPEQVVANAAGAGWRLSPTEADEVTALV